MLYPVIAYETSNDSEVRHIHCPLRMYLEQGEADIRDAVSRAQAANGKRIRIEFFADSHDGRWCVHRTWVK